MAKVLIVDDSSFTRHLLGVIVKMGGHEVAGVAEDGEQALKLFRSLRPDLVTLDWLMPSKSGEAVLKKIMMLDPDAKVIMITGWANKSIEGRVLAAGAKAFLEKSNVQRDLLNVIDQVMGETV
jgi:two-component system chemotaxis response regulator CheY